MDKFKEYVDKHKHWIISGCIFIIVLSIFTNIMMYINKPEEIQYTEFLDMIDGGEVEEVIADFKNGEKIQVIDKEENTLITDNPKKDEFKEFLLLNNITVTEEKQNTTFTAFISLFFELLIMCLFFMLIMRMMMPEQATKEVVAGNIPDTTFDDIAGCKELKKDLMFLVEFLKNPDKYKEMGAVIPKGVVLYGPPGTGKTLTARAIAGTAKVPFYSVSGSDFVEMYVGLGSKRVRQLFKEARKNAPSIIFIDEIDAVGSHRGKSGNSEQDQTINALLNELDGFTPSDNVICICATNRIEDLDKALIRPGRFDKHFAVPLPERDDRLEAIKIHTKTKKLSKEIDLNEVATMTVGFSGAAIASLLNEAAFLAVNEGANEILMEHIDHAFYKQVMKGDKKENQSARDKKELEIVAWHEAGHAIATKKYTTDSVSKVTIASSTSGAGGVTFKTPDEMSLYSKSYIEGTIKSLYAGRISEKFLLKSDNEITIGAREDIRQATNLIKEYITTFGMDDNMGMLNLETLVGDFHNDVIIEQAKELAKRLYSEAEKDLEKDKHLIEKVAVQLLKNETINEKELDEILNNEDFLIK